MGGGRYGVLVQTCEWNPNYAVQLSGTGVPRKYTCVPGSTPAETQGPRCNAQAGRSADFIEAWLNEPDDTHYLEVEPAQALCEKASRASPGACTGVAKEGPGWVLKSGNLITPKPGGTLFTFNCQCSSS